MGLFSLLSSRESVVKNERLEAEISKVCEELTNGIIELSEKAKKLNELKEQYNKSSSELQATATSDENSKPAENKSFFSNLLSLSGLSGDNKTPSAPPPTPNVSENIDADANSDDSISQPDELPNGLPNESSMSAASTVVPEMPSSSFESLSEAPSVDDKQPNTPFSSNDSSSSSSSDMFSPSSDKVLPAPVPNSLGEPPVPAPVPVPVPALPPVSVPNSLGKQQPAPGVEADGMADDKDTSEPPKIGGKKKRSKRSKKTISNSTKKPRNLTKKKKNVSDDNTARPQGQVHKQAQGLAQTLLQAHAQI